MKKKALLIGGIFGLIAPFVGIFLGLQLSTLLGNILAFPLIILVMITGLPFGMWHPLFMLFALILSSLCWALLFGAISTCFRHK